MDDYKLLIIGTHRILSCDVCSDVSYSNRYGTTSFESFGLKVGGSCLNPVLTAYFTNEVVAKILLYNLVARFTGVVCVKKLNTHISVAPYS